LQGIHKFCSSSVTIMHLKCFDYVSQHLTLCNLLFYTCSSGSSVMPFWSRHSFACLHHWAQARSLRGLIVDAPQFGHCLRKSFLKNSTGFPQDTQGCSNMSSGFQYLVSCPGQDTLGATTIPDFLPGNSGDIYNVIVPLYIFR
jgi:hypothetical protein